MKKQMTIKKRNAALLALALGTGSALAVDGVWVTNATGGNWDDLGKWVDDSIPGGVGATADSGPRPPAISSPCSATRPP